MRRPWSSAGSTNWRRYPLCSIATLSRNHYTRGYANQSPDREGGVALVRQQTLGSQPLAYARGSDWRPHARREGSAVTAFARCGMIPLENKNAGAYWKRWVVFLRLERSVGLRIH